MIQAQLLQDDPRDIEFRTFAATLLHADWGAYYPLQGIGPGGWRRCGCLTRDRLRTFSVSQRGRYDTYIAHNGFGCSTLDQDRLKHVNGLLFDVDCHGSDPAGQAKESALFALYDAMALGTLPKPTMIVDTGRGYQLHYVFERSVAYRVGTVSGTGVNRRVLCFLEVLRERLNSVLDDVLAGIPGVVNDHCVGNLNRVCRVPGTWNSRSRSYATLLHHGDGYWSLDALNAALPHLGRRGTAPTVCRPVKLDALLMRRMAALERLQTHRVSNSSSSCQGTRNELCFVYMNTAADVYGLDSAYTLAKRFNEKFPEPLADGELRATYFGLRRNGTYRLRRETLIGHLSLTAAEIEATCFFGSKRASDREAAKAATAERRSARMAEVASMHASGMSYSEIVDAYHARGERMSTWFIAKAVKAEPLQGAPERRHADFGVVPRRDLLMPCVTVENGRMCRAEAVSPTTSIFWQTYILLDGAFETSMEESLGSGRCEPVGTFLRGIESTNIPLLRAGP